MVEDGIEDTIFPIEDMYLLLQHGDAKAARFYRTGHMGYTPETMPTIVKWIAQTLSA
ncbi:MAG TPA: hypothetical protein VJR47_10550 [Stellaceae bacterium]|nr:hypothetical protein [Stellaceae bacterium]